MLTVRKFSKKYSERLILSIPELSFPAGVHWIKGENGAGKSTLFRSIAGLIPFEGSIAFSDGVCMRTQAKKFLQRVTYGEAEPVYPGFVSARDLVTFVGNARHASQAERDSLLESFGINEYWAQPSFSYSSGMLKKVSLAMCFLGDPQVIVLDEPFVTLDASAQQTLASLIRDFVTKKETLILISSQQTFDQLIPIKSVFTIHEKSLMQESVSSAQ